MIFNSYTLYVISSYKLYMHGGHTCKEAYTTTTELG